MNTFFKKLPNYESCIISDGVVKLFNRRGLCYNENAGLVPAYTTNALRVEICSVFSYNGRTEVFISFSDGNVKKYEKEGLAIEALFAFASRRDCVSKLTRNYNTNLRGVNVSLEQSLFVFPQGTDVVSVVSKLGFREVI